MVLVVTSPSAETVPLQPNQRPPCRLSSERTATASPPACWSWLGTATRFDNTTSRANSDPPNCATARSRSILDPYTNRSREHGPTMSRFAGQYPAITVHDDFDTLTRLRTSHAPL